MLLKILTRFDLLGEVFHLLSRSSVDFLEEFLEFAGDVGGVAIEDGGVAVSDFSGVVEHNDLGGEVFGSLGRVVFGVGRDVSTADILRFEID